MSIFSDILSTHRPVKRFGESGISKQEKRIRAQYHAKAAPQGNYYATTEQKKNYQLNVTVNARIARNEWVKQVYGGLAYSPKKYKTGATN